MMNDTTNTIMLTTKCSGGCKHCSFSNPDLDKLFLNPNVVQRIISNSTSKLTILSGGEPFEHPEISQILDKLSKQTTPFRIATGGFIDLVPWVNLLKNLYCSSGTLQGISMGTDILSSRVNHSDWITTWMSNIRLLINFNIPFSLTFSIGDDLDFTHLNIWKWTEQFNGQPEFIYLRYNEELLLRNWIPKIKRHFHGIPIIQDNWNQN